MAQFHYFTIDPCRNSRYASLGAEISGGVFSDSPPPMPTLPYFQNSWQPHQLLQLLLCQFIVPAPHILEFLEHAAINAAAQHPQIFNTDPPEECANIAVKVA